MLHRPRPVVSEAARIRRFRWLLLFIWTAVIAVLLAWESWGHYEQVQEDARISARSQFEKDVAYRRWNASLGGVYVPVSEDTPPNPYLDVPNRDVVTDTGQRLTLMNPAYMTRLVNGLMQRDGLGKGHITSLKPIRPANAPDPWEAEALRAFEQGKTEISGLETMDGGLFMRLMRPLHTGQPCLKCHAAQGYELGDIRGGISISVPMEARLAGFWGHIRNTVLGYSALWLLGLLGIQGGTRSLSRGAEQRARAEGELAAKEAHYRQALAFTDTGSWEYDVIGQRAYLADGIERLWGMQPGTFRGNLEQVTGAIHPDDRDAWREDVRACIEDGQEHDLEYRLVDPNGAVHWVRAWGNAERDAAGRAVRLSGLVTDVTERRGAQERYRELVDNMSDGVAVYRGVDDGQDFVFVEYNQAGERIGGMPKGQVIGRRVTEVYPGVVGLGLMEVLRRVWRTGAPEELPARAYQDQRLKLWVENYVFRIPSGEVVAVYQDITERKLAEEKLREAAAVFASTAEGVTITNLDGVIREVNDAFTEITGYPRDEVVGRGTRVLQSGRHDRPFYQALWKALLDTGQWRGEIWNRRKDGSVYPELLTISTVRDELGQPTGYVGVFTDITAIKQSEERLDHLAHHDPLTDLPNRLLFNARLRQSIRHSFRQQAVLAVVFVDLDRFKHINDSLGHPAGDQLLRQLSVRLSGAVRADDTVSRISGDEFVVLLEDIDGAEHAAVAVDKLMEAFKQPFAIGDNEVRITASMGLSLYPQDGDDASTLLRNADAAMYRAKEDGRNTYEFYTSEMTTVAFEHVFLENALREALDNEEFALVYQPQVNLASGRFVGMEALLRWHHPKQGIISPARFIPIAEQSGLIRDIGTWVLKTACAQGRIWLDQGLEFGRIAVNVASPQIQGANFRHLVETALEATGLPPEQLALEVTEGFVMRRAEAGIEQLQALRALGVEIAIDDFGTGYSSLSYLKQLPIDKLKIDQSFVRDIPRDADDMAISAAVIAMGVALDMKVIAEGVETEEQAAFLRDKGCREAQGYLFGRPVPAEKIVPLLS